jgi:hypothetical protein
MEQLSCHPITHLLLPEVFLMSQNLRFKLNQPSVIGEVIDNEAIIVNLDSGTYYSLRAVGADIWQMIEQGATVAEIINQLAHQYTKTEQTVIQTDVESFVMELQEEALILPLEDSSVAGESALSPLHASDGDQLLFQKPVLEKYTDMADLLLLDPIHEVDETGGWPHPPA